MINCVKESFHFTNKYIILATPLILFSLLSSLYLIFSVNGNNIVSLIIAVILFVLMLASFLSGWFYMIVCAIKNSDNEDSNSLISEFPSGVGEYFLPTLGLIIVTFIFSTIIMTITYIAGLKFIGNTGISPDMLTKATASTEALKSFVSSLTPAQIEKLNLWNILLISISGLISFLVMFYSPALFFKNKNPFKALFLQFKDMFSLKILKNILFFVMVIFSYFFVSIIGAFAGMNIITNFIFTLINFYYLVFIAILIFDYYYKNFVKIGGNIDTRV